MSGCLVHYQYQAKIIEVRLRRGSDQIKVWTAIDTVAKSLGYHLSSGSETGGESRTYARSLHFFSPASTINVEFNKTSNLFRLTKKRVGQTKGDSSWDIDSRVTELRDRLAEALPGFAIMIVTIKAEGQADLFPLGDYTPFRARFQPAK